MKIETRRVNYESGGNWTVIDYFLVCKSEHSMVSDVMVIPACDGHSDEECVSWLLICKVVSSEQFRLNKVRF